MPIFKRLTASTNMQKLQRTQCLNSLTHFTICGLNSNNVLQYYFRGCSLLQWVKLEGPATHTHTHYPT